MKVEQVKKLLRAYDIRPTKGKGQNFLLDEQVIRDMVDAARVSGEDTVLEIGPGLGILTRALLERAGKVVAVELDANVATFLRAEFGGNPKFHLVTDDILRLRPEDLRALTGDRYKVVANLPYAITSPVIEKLLTVEPRPTQIVVMVQKEVAQRITAAAGEMSVLAIACQYYATAELVRLVSRTVFHPAPQVDSAVVRLSLTDRERDAAREKDFFRLVHIGFSARRKQLHNNLAAGLHRSSDEMKKMLEMIGKRPDTRAQELTVHDWERLRELLATTK